VAAFFLSLILLLEAPGALAQQVAGIVPQVSAVPTSILEGQGSVFTVALSGSVLGNPSYLGTAIVGTFSGSAQPGADYTSEPSPTNSQLTLDFKPGETSKAVLIAARTDIFSPEGAVNVVFTVERCEYLVSDVEFGSVRFSCPAGASDQVVIADVSPPPTVTIEATDPDASKEGPDLGEFTVRLSTPAPRSGLRVNYSVGGSAVPGEDYRALTGSVFVPGFESSAPIAVEPMTGAASGETTVVATLQPGVGYEVGQPSSATVTIAPPRLVATIEATDPDASKEGPDLGEFTVRLSTPAPRSGLRVNYSVGGSAVPGEDYRALSGSVSVAGGQMSATIVVEPLTTGPRGDTTVVLVLQGGTGYEVGQPASATVKIAGAVEPTIVLAVQSGNRQVASTGQPLQPFVVTASSNGAVAAGVPILWMLEVGEGNLSSQRTLTDARGQASTVLTPTGDGEFVVRALAEGSDESVVFTGLFNPLSGLPGLTDNERRVATAIETLCPGLREVSAQRPLTPGEQDLLTQCTLLIDNSVTNPGAAAEGVVALTPQQASAPRKLMTQVTGAQVDNIVTRLMALRRGVRGVNLGNLSFNLRGQSINGNSLAAEFPQPGDTGGGAAADEAYEFERWGFFVNGNIDWGSKDRTANEDGFDFNTLGVTAGVDYRFADGLVLGLALGYGDTNADIDANRGDLDTTAWSGTVYGTYYPTDHFYLEGSATYGWGDYDQTRNISYSLLEESRKANADFDGNQYALMLGAGYDVVGGGGILDLYGRVRYVRADIDSYRERGALGLELNIDSQKATSFLSTLGVNYTRSVSMSWAVLVPQGWFEWAHEFDDGDDEVSGFFSNDPNRIPFALATDKLDSDYFRLGLGVGAQFGQGRMAFVSYEAAVGLNSYREQNVNLGVRLEF